MTENNGTLHGVSVGITAVLVAALGLSVTVLAKPDEQVDQHDVLKDMVVIEASLAMKTNKKKATQPQKDMRAPDPTKKVEGVKKDDAPPDKKDPDKKDDKKEDKDPKIDPNAPLPKHADDTTPVGPVVQPFNPNESNTAGKDQVTKNEYVAVIKTRLDELYNASQIDRGTSIPQGCLQIDKTGKILDTKFNTHDSDDHQTMAEDALKKFVAERNQHPIEVPVETLELTSKWLCFNFKVQ